MNMRIHPSFAAVCAAFALAFLAGCSPAEAPVLNVEGGQIQGVASSVKGVYIYKGVPFAAPPVGDLRWKEPQPVVPWEGVRQADTFGPGAWQAPHDSSNPWTSEFYWEDPEFSEDCLYLNVWTPAPGKAGAKLPVAMWIHGGAYTGGWGYEPEFDGKVWAQKGVVLVTINYRLGIFGFLNHPLLAEESPHGVSGNYGILDQIAALKWIHENIAAFGGDPENITILGQSAGAGSVKTLVTSPLTGDLIKKAIIQSEDNKISEEEAAARFEKLQYLKQSPREEEENVLTLLRASRIYEETMGPERNRITELVNEFEESLSRKTRLEIETDRKKLEELLDEIENKNEKGLLA